MRTTLLRGGVGLAAAGCWADKLSLEGSGDAGDANSGIAGRHGTASGGGVGGASGASSAGHGGVPVGFAGRSVGADGGSGMSSNRGGASARGDGVGTGAVSSASGAGIGSSVGGAGSGSGGSSPRPGGDATNCGDEQYWDSTMQGCVALTTCVAGEYVSSPPSAVTDRACKSCGDGWYSEQQNAAVCSECRVCGSLGSDGDCTPRHDTPCRHLGFSATFGTNNGDEALSIAVDGAGNVWVAGFAGDVPSDNDSQSRGGFVRRFLSDGSDPQTDFFGTSEGDDQALAVAVDAHGTAWVTGYTDGNLGGINNGSYDVFVRKYRADGSAPTTELFGTTEEDMPAAVAADASGNVWIVGYTNGDLGGHNAGSNDVFVRKYPADGSAPITDQFGGANPDSPQAAVVDSAGNLWVAGDTYVPDPKSQNGGAYDGFVRKYPANGSAPIDDQFGTNAQEWVHAMTVDHSGNVWVTGVTEGNFVGKNSGGWDIFVRKYPADGSAPTNEQFGTPGDEGAYGMTVDRAGNVWIAGSASCNISGNPLDVTTPAESDYMGNTIDMVKLCAPLGPGMGEGDVFARIYPADGSPPQTYQFGTTLGEAGTGIAAGIDGSVWISGFVGYGTGLDAAVWQLTP